MGSTNENGGGGGGDGDGGGGNNDGTIRTSSPPLRPPERYVSSEKPACPTQHFSVMLLLIIMTTTTMTMTTIVIMLFTVATDPPPGWDAAAQGYRSGRATTSHSCNYIRGVPNHLRSSAVMKPSGLSNFYQKYTEAYGIPVLGRYLCQLSVQLLPEVHRSLWNTCVR